MMIITLLQADVICLQEVETDQFYNFFQSELKKDGYAGLFAPKSRARTMQDSKRKHVDGCAIFYKSNKWVGGVVGGVVVGGVGGSVAWCCWWCCR